MQSLDWVIVFSYILVTLGIGVYLAPPLKSAEDSAFPPFFEVMNNSESFDARTMDAWLRGSRPLQ